MAADDDNYDLFTKRPSESVKVGFMSMIDVDNDHYLAIYFDDGRRLNGLPRPWVVNYCCRDTNRFISKHKCETITKAKMKAFELKEQKCRYCYDGDGKMIRKEYVPEHFYDGLMIPMILSPKDRLMLEEEMKDKDPDIKIPEY